MIPLKPLSVGKLVIDPPILQAPMSGITGRAFRRFLRELNPGAIGCFYTEFASVEGLIRHNKATVRLLCRSEEDRPTLFAAQIFGRDPEHMAEGARVAESLGADLVDINAGCPAPCIVKKGGGADLLKNPDLIGEIVRKVKSAVRVPISVKIRTGWDEQNINILETTRIIRDAGADMLTIHGRTKSQGYKGSADWELISRIKALHPGYPIVGNGDITDPETALHRLGSAGVDAIMIARGMLQDPLIFVKTIAHAGNGTVPEFAPSQKEGLFRRYAQLLSEDGLPEKAVLGKMKQLAVKHLRERPHGAEIRTAALRSDRLDDFFTHAKRYFE